jgi:hypothetical protein
MHADLQLMRMGRKLVPVDDEQVTSRRQQVAREND